MKTLGCIGTGNMAGAILKGICAQGVLPAENLRVFDQDPAKTQPFVQLGAKACESLRMLIEQSEMLLFGVKPQNLDALLDDLAALGGVGDRLLISIVAGKPAEAFFHRLGEQVRLVLVMPNTPLLLGSGATAIGRGYHTSDEEFQFVCSMFSASGVIGVVEAGQLNEMIAVNGSTPAFFYRFCKIIAEHAAEMGVDPEIALRLSAATMAGAAKMIQESGYPVDELIRMVSSPGGTTLAGLAAMEQAGFDDAVRAAMDASVRRAYELGQGR